MKRILFFVAIVFVLSDSIAFASTADGTIDSTNKYAWGENLGWLNFGTSGGNIHVTDTALTGYIWSENYGWINLAPAGSGVTNNNEGVLGGYAWGENLGYIGFSGVMISSAGLFSGTASGTVAGRISFGCTNCTVSTDWRPASARGGSGGGSVPGVITGTGGGSSPPSTTVSDLFINNGASSTISPTVTLTITGSADVGQVLISNYPDFRGGIFEPFQPTKIWNICTGSLNLNADCVAGVYKVYIRFYTAGGEPLQTIERNIAYTPEFLPQELQTTEPTPSSILQRLTRSVQSLFARIFGVPLPPSLEFPNGSEIVVRPLSEEIPLAFRNLWNLLPQKRINQFVFAPLPREVATIAQKFPGIQNVFRNVGVARATDITKLNSISLNAPGLAKSSGIISPPINAQKIAPLPGIPVNSLPQIAKDKIPTEIVFARSENQRIDFDLKLSLNQEGILEKRIQTIVGKKITLVVKAEKGAKSVKGYLVFRSKATNALERSSEETSQISLRQALASPLFAIPAFAEVAKPATYIPINGAKLEELQQRQDFAVQNNNSGIEERLALLEFEYTDPDNDGIYTAEIDAPRVAGEYDVITIITYNDPDRGAREIRLTAVVDPEGYVYESAGGKEVRIPGAVVSLYALDPATKKYKLWLATDYAQENPQVTDNRGTYAFLVPPGYYYIAIEAPGYLPYQGESFSVAENNEVHSNIELRTKYWFANIADWKTILLIIAALMLLYHFYEDRKRQKLETALLENLASQKHKNDIINKGHPET